jgi:serine/threonine protein kinase
LSAEYTLPKFLSEEAKDMISKIFVTNPDERIDIEEIRNHPWYKLHQPEC